MLWNEYGWYVVTTSCLTEHGRHTDQVAGGRSNRCSAGIPARGIALQGGGLGLMMLRAVCVPQVRQQVVEALADNLDVDGTCVMDYVRLRYKAVK